jgi:hypothetical protein
VRYLGRVAACAAVIVLCLGAAPAAQAGHKQDAKLLPATARIAGFTGGELLGEQWRQWLELPTDQNSFLLNGDLCMFAGHKHKVLMGVHSPLEPTVCKVKPGTPVFFSTSSAECSNVEDEPYNGGTTEAGQQACALAALAGLIPDAILVTVDGAEPVSLLDERFLAVSPQGMARLPDDNIAGVDASDASFAAAGYVGLLRPLRPGRHSITVEYLTTGSDPVIQRLIVIVRGRSRDGW